IIRGRKGNDHALCPQPLTKCDNAGVVSVDLTRGPRLSIVKLETENRLCKLTRPVILEFDQTFFASGRHVAESQCHEDNDNIGGLNRIASRLWGRVVDAAESLQENGLETESLQCGGDSGSVLAEIGVSGGDEGPNPVRHTLLPIGCPEIGSKKVIE